MKCVALTNLLQSTPFSYTLFLILFSFFLTSLETVMKTNNWNEQEI